MNNQPDFKVENHGSIIRFTPITDSAKAEVEGMGLEGWQFMGDSFHVDTRIAHDLILQLENNGFILE